MVLQLKSKRKILAALLMIAASISATPPVSAIGFLYDGTSGDVACTLGYFTIVDNVITGQTSCSGTVEIPEGVTRVSMEAFIDATSSITNLTIANSVTTIEDQAFIGASSLRKITFGSGLQEIGSGVFSGATSLRSLTIPRTLTGIGSGAFSGATSLTTVIIPATILFIWDGAFSGATSLSSMYFLGAAPSLMGLDPFLNTPLGASAYVNAANLTSFGVLEGESWNGLTLRIGAPVSEEQNVDTDTQRAAAAALREAAQKAARDDLLASFRDGKRATAGKFVEAGISGITESNIAGVNSEIALLAEDSRKDIAQILKIARKYEIVAKIGSDQVNRVYPNLYIEIGLIPADSKNKSSLVRAVRMLSPENRRSFESIKSAIEAELRVIQERAKRLAVVRSPKTSR